MEGRGRAWREVEGRETMNTQQSKAIYMYIQHTSAIRSIRYIPCLAAALEPRNELSTDLLATSIVYRALLDVWGMLKPNYITIIGNHDTNLFSLMILLKPQFHGIHANSLKAKSGMLLVRQVSRNAGEWN